ncbi:hypothetical protein LXL04_014260 [Taraxacum kok-saghyz]
MVPNTRANPNRTGEGPVVVNRVEEMEANIDSVQSEIGSMRDQFQSEIGNLNSEMGAIKKMLEMLLKQNAETTTKQNGADASTSNPINPLIPQNAQNSEVVITNPPPIPLIQPESLQSPIPPFNPRHIPPTSQIPTPIHQIPTPMHQIPTPFYNRSQTHSQLHQPDNSYGMWGNDRPYNRGNAEPNRFFAIKGRKLELPIFDGKDPDGWIMRAERYFHLNRLTEEEQIEVAIISFKGDALRWFQWEHRRQMIYDWRTLKALMLKQFRSCTVGSLCEQFLALKQEGTMEDYRRKFVSLAAPLEGISEEVFLSQFINGLNPVIKAELRLLDPINLNMAKDMVAKIEEKNRVISSQRSNTFNNYKRYTMGNNEVKPSVIPAPRANNVNDRVRSEFRRLTDAELQSKRAQGLCYRCDEKYAPGHVCKRKELSVLVTQDREEDGEEEWEEIIPEEEVKEKVEVHLNSVMGFSNPKTMKVEGEIEGQKVVILIDCGATHNFISHETVRKLKIPIEATEGYLIAMGTGVEVNSKGVCKKVKLKMQGLEICEEFLPLKLGNSDVILGMQWLVKLGLTHTNWATQTMKFHMEGRLITLKGNPSLERSMVSLKTISKVMQQEGHGVFIELGEVIPKQEEKMEEEKSKEWEDILHTYDKVFRMPKELPPLRGREHAIVLRDGCPPVNVRPYRYPHYQKDEIEKLVKEMLEAGVIQASKSPFSSPVLLVKKKMEVGGFVLTIEL